MSSRLACSIQTLSRLTAGGTYGGIFPAPNNGTNFQLRESAQQPTGRDHLVLITTPPVSSIYGSFVAERLRKHRDQHVERRQRPISWNTLAIPRMPECHTAYAISPNLVNEASFNYNGNRIHILPAGLVSRRRALLLLRFSLIPVTAKTLITAFLDPVKRQHRYELHDQLDALE